MLDSELSAALRVTPPNPYVYKSALKRAVARGIDALGDFWMAPSPRELDWDACRSVAVLRLDHLGDLLNAFPALDALRRRLPKARIDLFVGPWGRELAQLCPSVDSVVVVDAPWFRRPERVDWPWKSIALLAQRIRDGRYDLAVELRGDLRHHLALWASGTPQRLGHALTAGRFLLTNPGIYRPGIHEIDQNLSLIGAQTKGAKVRLRLPASARAGAAQVMKALGLKPGFVAVQAACGTPAKRWIPGRWAQLIKGLPAKYSVVLLGSEQEREEMASIAAQCGTRRPRIAAGMLSLSSLAALLKQAKLLISVDSGPAHLAAAVGTPVLGLYSGTNMVGQWGVRGRQVHILRAEVPCSPCELSSCPYTNECMRRIGEREALEAAKAML
jgi:ADP-heptose:LPS heptosyltransferase